MTLIQLRYLCEIVRQGLHLSRAAEALHTSQPGVSKQIQLLEQELGCTIFKRRRNRLLDLTPKGREVHHYAQQALIEIDNIRSVSQNSDSKGGGTLVIACMATQARYVLPRTIDRFIKKYPDTRLEFFQGDRQQIFAKVDAGEADIAIGGDRGVSVTNVAMLHYDTLRYVIVARPGHPILEGGRPTLRQVASYPIITHMFEPDGQWKLVDVFKRKGLEPKIAFRAADSEVAKAYVELGVGIAILARSSFEKQRDRFLRAIDADHLFAPEPLYIGFHRKKHMPKHLGDLIRMLSPELSAAEIEHARLHGGSS
ncbi:MAG TPA: LysR substrate-binding domain-containing protein [Xanthobacteraceae bacterium]|nr:LysR substrate-binding domain-containing protein [Xanthobacteraceae bacterium]